MEYDAPLGSADRMSSIRLDPHRHDHRPYYRQISGERKAPANQPTVPRGITIGAILKWNSSYRKERHQQLKHKLSEHGLTPEEWSEYRALCAVNKYH